MQIELFPFPFLFRYFLYMQWLSYPTRMQVIRRVSANTEPVWHGNIVFEFKLFPVLSYPESLTQMKKLGNIAPEKRFYIHLNYDKHFSEFLSENY
jgi:hypothetical protein